jgi:hypothetical protein
VPTAIIYNIRLEGRFPRTGDGDVAELDAQLFTLRLELCSLELLVVVFVLTT